jgi:hypothetical protein
LFLKLLFDAVRNAFDSRVADGTFLAGFAKPGKNFSSIIGLTTAILFDHPGENVIKTFVRGDSPFAVETLTTAADDFSFLGES